MRKLMLFGAACVAFALAGLAANGYYYGPNEEITVDSAVNNAASVLVLGSDNTLKLTGAPDAKGVYTFSASIIATNGPNPSFTIDGSALTGATALRMTGHVATRAQTVKGASPIPAAGMTVKGFTKIIYGEATANNLTTRQLASWCVSDVTFTDDPGEIVFTNTVTMCATPTCPWSVADGSSLWVGPGIAFPFADQVVDGVFTLGNFDLGLSFDITDLPNEIRVPADRILAYFPFYLSWGSSHALDPWYWAGDGAKTFPCDITLADASAKLLLNSAQKHTFTGRMTGAGTIRYSNSGRVVFQNAVDMTGTIEFDLNATLECAGAAGTVLNVGVLGRNGSSGTVNVRVGDGNALTVGTLRGAFDVQGAGAFTVNSFTADAALSLGAGMTATLNTPPTALLTLTEGDGSKKWTINGPADATLSPTFIKDVAGGYLTLGGKLDIGSLSGFDGVIIATGAQVTGDVGDMPIKMQGGSFAYAVRGWQSKLALWLDASAASSITTVREAWGADITKNSPVYVSNGQTYDYVQQWRDCRPGQDRFVTCTRAKSAKTFDEATSVPTVIPYFVPAGDENKGPAGRGAYVSLAGSNRNLQICTSSPDDRTPLAAEYAIAVFGSQNGGGGSLLALTDGGLARKKGTNKAGAAYAIVSNTVNGVTGIATNGIPVNPLETGFNGGWQIVSADLAGRMVGGLGYARETGAQAASLPDRGYSEYAEVLIFGTRPTPLEIQQAEDYLAAKWGLPVTHPDPAEERPCENTLAGTGTLTLSKSLVADGFFDGTIDLNGNTLSLAEGRYPLADAEIPAANRLAWFDPSLPATVELDADHPGEVASMYQRDNAGEPVTTPNAYYVATAYKPTEDYRPCYVAGAREFGSAAGWLDNFDGSDARNTFFFYRLDPTTGERIYPEGIDNATMTSLAPRTFFMVLDTSFGGGSPFLDWASGNGDLARRRTATDPIWRANQKDSFGELLYGPTYRLLAGSTGHTYLDGVEVDGTTQSFSGRPEVLTVRTGAMNAAGEGPLLKSVGTYNNDKGTFREVVGEILAYSTELDDDTRADIEAYLMKKWFGKMREGYQDFRGMTVTGAGSLVVPSFKALPQLGAGFTGDIAVTNEVQTFTFAAGATVAAEAVDIATTALALPDEVTVNLVFAQVPDPGVYTLFAANLQGAPAFSLGTVQGFSRPDRLALKWNAAAKQLQVIIRTQGTSILLR
ncbi:MAG: hypothetical protein MJ240_01230 [Kiritimatiellae bacterium]|nr:hypothetical protein [Kiritimatiellia bacterium]